MKTNQPKIENSYKREFSSKYERRTVRVRRENVWRNGFFCQLQSIVAKQTLNKLGIHDALLKAGGAIRSKCRREREVGGHLWR